MFILTFKKRLVNLDNVEDIKLTDDKNMVLAHTVSGENIVVFKSDSTSEVETYYDHLIKRFLQAYVVFRIEDKPNEKSN